MAISTEVIELVALLTEEGYGTLAGELLTEISLGRELPPHFAQKVDPPTEEIEDEVRRVEIPEDEQLSFACDILILRLVEPVRRLAEAERGAASLLSQEQNRPDAVSIRFSRSRDDSGPTLARAEGAGQSETADALQEILTQLRSVAI